MSLLSTNPASTGAPSESPSPTIDTSPNPFTSSFNRSAGFIFTSPTGGGPSSPSLNSNASSPSSLSDVVGGHPRCDAADSKREPQRPWGLPSPRDSTAERPLPMTGPLTLATAGGTTRRTVGPGDTQGTLVSRGLESSASTAAASPIDPPAPAWLAFPPLVPSASSPPSSATWRHTTGAPPVVPYAAVVRKGLAAATSDTRARSANAGVAPDVRPPVAHMVQGPGSGRCAPPQQQSRGQDRLGRIPAASPAALIGSVRSRDEGDVAGLDRPTAVPAVPELGRPFQSRGGGMGGWRSRRKQLSHALLRGLWRWREGMQVRVSPNVIITPVPSVT